MKTEHTPGPWKTDKWNYPNRGEVTMIVTGSDAIAEMSPLWRPDAPREDPLAESEIMANARLIAAAPEFLAALYSIATDPSAVFDGPNAFLGDIARAAIAKATTL